MLTAGITANKKHIMNKNKPVRFFLLAFMLFFTGRFCYSQDSTNLQFRVDSTLNPTVVFVSMSSVSSDYFLIHSPSKEDSVFCKKQSKLITAEPSKRNYVKYYSLACSLWELGRQAEAEKMFLKIMDSSQPFYVGTYYHSSDIPGDTTTNSYGYGSYTSNYKNYACRYLSKIYIEEKKFDQALKYIELADKKYIAEQGCGTGYMWYRQEIDGLYGLSYEGLERYDSTINMFLPNCFYRNNATLVRALKKVYSPAEIAANLEIAEKSVICVADTFQSSSFTTLNYGEKNESTIETKYTSGKGTITLFGRQIELPPPRLGEGETATKEIFLKIFKESGFYTALTADNG